jgi:preprotein translocase subunit SecE
MAQVMSEDPKNSSKPDDEDDLPLRASTAGAPAGFFHIYKHGQGYWTRLCTALAAFGLLLLIANFAYTQSHLRLAEVLTTDSRPREAAAALARNISLALAAAIVLGGGAFAWKLMNAPKGADFLITTDSEMKKVNWATRKELIGSTRVVIIFLVLIACFLFGADLLFGWFFHVIGVLKTGPLG